VLAMALLDELLRAIRGRAIMEESYLSKTDWSS
jgi:hypothetical protein